MKQQIALLFFVVLLLSSFSSAYARLLLQQEGLKQGQNEVIIDNTLVHTSHDELKDDIEQLMGYENCDEKNEECKGRRIILEAHLDYIYTQNVHHKP
ncbi:hypothetical protein PIB30_066891 [Stylosanthes scabra]|uniref:Phytosulfokine n=1 Tax=Stylosanthes scabra TaxID=79078 RepID=A0ABU6UN15_9FABA|nr:hypothetical protein [Stylosanthes scabra]